MKRLGPIVAALLVLLAVASAVAEEKARASARGSGKSVLMSAEERKWIAPSRSLPGTEMAVLWGDPARDAHGAMHRFRAGSVAPLHHHTSDQRMVVVSGTLFVTPEGEPERKLGAGSFFAFSGRKSHAIRCDSSSECVLYAEAAGAWDVVMPGSPKG